MKNTALLYSLFISLGLHGLFFTAGMIERKTQGAMVSFKQGPSSIQVKISGPREVLKEKNMSEKRKTIDPTPIESVKESGVLKGALAKVNIAPEYPARSVLFEEEGIVTVLVEIDSQGVVKSAVVENSSGHVRLDEAALKAARETSFTPATLDGENIESRETLEFNFKLK